MITLTLTDEQAALLRALLSNAVRAVESDDDMGDEYTDDDYEDRQEKIRWAEVAARLLEQVG